MANGSVASCLNWHTGVQNYPWDFRNLPASQYQRTTNPPRYFVDPNESTQYYDRQHYRNNKYGQSVVTYDPKETLTPPTANVAPTTWEDLTWREGVVTGERARSRCGTPSRGGRYDDERAWRDRYGRPKEPIRGGGILRSSKYHQHCHPSHPPRGPKKAQFMTENNRRVVEVIEEGRRGRPGTMVLSRTNTPVYDVEVTRDYHLQRPEEKWAQLQQREEKWAELQGEEKWAESVQQRRAVAVGSGVTQQLMNTYQAGKADATFLQKAAVAPNGWRSEVARGVEGAVLRAEEEEERDTEKAAMLRSVQTRRSLRYPGYREAWTPEGGMELMRISGEKYTGSGIALRPGETYTGPGIVTRPGSSSGAMRRSYVTQERRGWDGLGGRSDNSEEQPNLVKVQFECPTNVDTLVSLRVRTSDVQ